MQTTLSWCALLILPWLLICDLVVASSTGLSGSTINFQEPQRQVSGNSDAHLGLLVATPVGAVRRTTTPPRPRKNKRKIGTVPLGLNRDDEVATPPQKQIPPPRECAPVRKTIRPYRTANPATPLALSQQNTENCDGFVINHLPKPVGPVKKFTKAIKPRRLF